jgi:hypothetical protein
LFEGIERGERGWSQSPEPRRSRAPAESRVIHPPNFHRAVVPHLGLVRNPAVGAISVAIKSQHVDLGLPTLFRDARLGRPDFQFAALEWNRLPHRRSCIDAVRGRE